MLILFHTVCLLVVIAAFMAEHSLSYSYICRFFMQSTPFLNFLLLLFFCLCHLFRSFPVRDHIDVSSWDYLRSRGICAPVEQH